MVFCYTFFDVPIGSCAMVWCEAGGIVRLFLPDNSTSLQSTIETRWPDAQNVHPKGEVLDVIKGVGSYFTEGREVPLTPLLMMKHMPSFYQRVYQRTQRIQRGAVATYKEIASDVGSPRAARAVGRAMSLNPFPLLIPCHRVLKSNEQLGGFSAPGGTSLKAQLLAMEGVKL
ncbi:methylated-DNA--[protein]-cysteine S-methyltransferase [Pajaroellobacter abortibovis]|uniref:methylated-DNA--[protein]-cysteine S-methyltransferase n=1 Tax=Pajaroellobacter abortibovis TaxID=1882918 RepID=A0A1L6MUU5_9BACT|nr:methylated-DNA--[protein]-cysteine S-methyltransferase [Pajaroellobacter abortibovis]APR99284.1 hypothetical protein BCY86_00290 [Pajaroellobacter abortibovis]